MGVRASVFESVQIGREATPGTRVPALVRLASTDIRPRPVTNVMEKRTAGAKFATGSINGREHTEAAISGDQDYNDLCYLLSANVCRAAVSTPGGAANTRRRVFKPDTFAPEDFDTFSVERGNVRDGGKRFQYGFIPDLTLNWTEQEATLSGTMLGRILSKGVPMSGDEVQEIAITGGTATSGSFTLTLGAEESATIAYNATAAAAQAALEDLPNVGEGNVVVVPFLDGAPAPAGTLFSAAGAVFRIQFVGALSQSPQAALVAADTFNAGNVTVTGLQDGAEIIDRPQRLVQPVRVGVFAGSALGGLVQLDDCISLEIQMGGRFVPQFVIDDRLPSFKQPVETAPEFRATLTLEDDSRVIQYLDALRKRQTRYLKVVAESDELIETVGGVPFPFRYEMTMPFRFAEEEDGSEDEFETGQFQMFGIHDAALGGAFEAVVDTDIATL